MGVLLNLFGNDPQSTAPPSRRGATRANSGRTHVKRVDPGACVILHDAAESILTCTEGRLWITESEQGVDIDLPTGHAVRLSHGGKTLVNSCQPSAFRLDWDPAGSDNRDCC